MKIVGLFNALMLLIGMSGAISMSLDVPVVPTAGVLFLLSHAIPQMPGVFMNTTVDAIAKYAGAYEKKLIGEMLNGLDFLKSKAIKIYRNVEQDLLLPNLTINGGIRPLDVDVETDARNNRTFSGRKLKVYPGMKIITMIPEQLRKMFKDRALDPKATQIPFAQFVWDEEFKKIGSEVNDNLYLSSYHGDAADYSAATAYVANVDYINFSGDIYLCIVNTVAGQSPTTTPASWSLVNDSVISDGWGTIIAAELVLGNITSVGTGALSSANAVTKVNQMYQALSDVMKNKGGLVLMSPTNYYNYITHLLTLYPSFANDATGDGIKYVFGSNRRWKIEEATWMAGSGRVIFTVEENLAFGTYQESDMNTIGQLVPTTHGLRTAVKWVQGCEIADLRGIKVNDQA